MKTFEIIGTVVYQDLSGGFWGIEDNEGNKWKPRQMPPELQKEGLNVKITANKVKTGMSIFMWGTAIEIKDYMVIS